MFDCIDVPVRPALRASVATARASRTEVVVLDRSLNDWHVLRAGIAADAEIVLIDPDRDGIAQLVAALRGRTNVAAIHLLSHGVPGGFHLGAAKLDLASLDQHAPALAAIGASLAPGADILIYSCETASGAGPHFLAALAGLTDANIAASTTPIGAAHLRGNWTLDYQLGNVTTPLALTEAAMQSYQHAFVPTPVYTSSAAYIAENTVTLTFNQALDAANPPDLNSFSVQVNGTGVSVTGRTVDSAAKTVTLTLSGNAFTPGDIVEFSYTDPTAGNDVLAIQTLGGVDAATFSSSTIVFGGRPVTTPVITAALTQDTGVAADNLTSNPAISGTANPNGTVTISNGNTVLGTATTNAQGAWSYTPTLVDGSYTLTVSQTSGGQTGTQTVSFALDATAPSASSTPDMTSASDTGASATDNITSNTTPTFTGTAEANATVRLYDTDGTTILGSTVANGAGRWSITASTLASGNHALTSKVTDAAGNTSSASSALPVTIDTATPPTPTVGLANDTNISNDNVTNNGTLSLGGILPNATVEYSDNNGAWTPTFTPVEGSNTVLVRQASLAGNVSAAGSYSFTLDTIAPPLTLALANDTGASATDHITNDSTLMGTTEPNSTIVVPLSDQLTAISDSNGHWEMSATGVALADGTYTLTAGTTDLAGNTTFTTLTFTLDTTPPAVTLALAHDTGASSTDGITNDDSLTGVGDPNATVSILNGATSLATVTADANGNWTVPAASLALPDGAYTLTASETDAAGNTGTQSVAFTLAATPPTAPSTPALAVTSDTGTIGDNLTSITAPAITGTGIPGDTVSLYDGTGETAIGTATIGSNGIWSITPTTPLGNGVHSLTAKQTNAAGTASAPSTALSLTIDTFIPDAPAITSMGGLTNVAEQTIAGLAIAGTTVQLFDGDTALGTVAVGLDGRWSLPATLASGSHSITAIDTNAAGTPSPASSPTIFNIHPPVDPVTAAPLPVIDPAGNGDFGVTNVPLGLSGRDPGTQYAGPVTNLQKQFIWNGTEQVSVVANTPNAFIHGGSGDDALQVTAGSNVLDGGQGSNFLVGALGTDSGTDTFFVDARTAAPTWSTIVNFHAGDQLTVWGFNDSNSQASWVGQAGVGTYAGATLRADVNGHGSSVTFANTTDAQAAAFTSQTGSIGGQDYLLITRAS